MEIFSGSFYNRFPELSFLVKKNMYRESNHVTSHVTKQDSSAFKLHGRRSVFVSKLGSEKLSIFKIT